jgi:hypothetical protein
LTATLTDAAGMFINMVVGNDLWGATRTTQRQETREEEREKNKQLDNYHTTHQRALFHHHPLTSPMNLILLFSQ